MNLDSDPLFQHGLKSTRRRFFSNTLRTAASALGAAAFADLLAADASAREQAAAVTGPHYRGKAKRVIYFHMEGAPSQLDLYDHKPGLVERFNQDLPDSIRQGQRLTGMTSGQSRFPVAPTAFEFKRYANRQDGVWLSELIPHTASLANDLCFIHSMHTDAINHEPGITFFQTGNQQPGRPSFGSWVGYGLGSMNKNLPTFVVLITQGIGNMQALSARFWGAGFLPSEHQGCRLRAGADPVLFLRDPKGVERRDRRRMLDLVAQLDGVEQDRTNDPETAARLAQQEMAFRMQMSVPDLVDFSDEDEATLAMYGEDVKKPGSFAANCLLARRMAERGVRFIQLYMRGWDAHNNLPNEMRAQCGAVDRAQAALLRDLKRRGLLDDTLVLWAGEFGRTVYSQGELSKTNYGRDHHPRCFTVWLAGGGIQPGITYGKTDDYSYNIVENPVEVHDLHATMLHLLGFDHTRLVYKHQGRDYRLTDVAGKVIPALLA